jgi:hypothetical protein
VKVSNAISVLPPTRKDLVMTTLKTIAAAAMLSVLAATPVFAQAAIQEPGAFAFYHPNLDVLNGGAPTPAAALAGDPAALQAYSAAQSGIGHVAHYHSHVGRR